MSLRESPAYIDLKRIEAARDISKLLGRSNNKVYLDAETLLLNLTHGLDENLEAKVVGHKFQAFQGEKQ